MTTRLYVSNLSNITTKQDLDILFGAFSDTVLSKLVRYRITQEPNGSAFINMFDNEEACNAIKGLHGTQILGKTIEVVMARARRKPQFSIQYWN